MVFKRKPGKNFYVIVRGKVSVFEGEEEVKEISKLTDGEYFGEMALLADLPRIWSTEINQPKDLVRFIPPALCHRELLLLPVQRGYTLTVYC